MRFKLDKPIGPLSINLIKALFWLVRILLIATIVFACFALVIFIVELVRDGLIYDYIRAVFKGEEKLSPLLLILPAAWFIAWCIQKLLNPWVKLANNDQLCDLFQKSKDYPVIETYLAEVSGKGRMISKKEYYCLDRMVKKDIRTKYWELGKESQTDQAE